MSNKVIIDVEAGECEACGGHVWDVYRKLDEDDREKMMTYAKKPAAKKAGRELAESAQEVDVAALLCYPEGGRTMTEAYEPAEQPEIAEVDESTVYGPTADELEAEAEDVADAGSY